MADSQTEDKQAQSQEAFQALVNLAMQSRRSAKGLPSQIDTQPHWSGIGFELLGRHFVAPMGEVSEMLEVPYYTRLPGVKPWVKGVANVRGRLLPVCDLAVFLGGRIQAPRKQQRILVLENQDLYTGLLVDRVLGMQHFPVDTYSPADTPSPVDAYSPVDTSPQNSDSPMTTGSPAGNCNPDDIISPVATSHAAMWADRASGDNDQQQTTPYCQGHFFVEGVAWTVFRPEMLSEDPQFLNAAQS